MTSYSRPRKASAVPGFKTADTSSRPLMRDGQEETALLFCRILMGAATPKVREISIIAAVILCLSELCTGGVIVMRDLGYTTNAARAGIPAGLSTRVSSSAMSSQPVMFGINWYNAARNCSLVAGANWVDMDIRTAAGVDEIVSVEFKDLVVRHSDGREERPEGPRAKCILLEWYPPWNLQNERTVDAEILIKMGYNGSDEFISEAVVIQTWRSGRQAVSLLKHRHKRSPIQYWAGTYWQYITSM